MRPTTRRAHVVRAGAGKEAARRVTPLARAARRRAEDGGGGALEARRGVVARVVHRAGRAFRLREPRAHRGGEEGALAAAKVGEGVAPRAARARAASRAEDVAPRGGECEASPPPACARRCGCAASSRATSCASRSPIADRWHVVHPLAPRRVVGARHRAAPRRVADGARGRGALPEPTGVATEARSLDLRPPRLLFRVIRTPPWRSCLISLRKWKSASRASSRPQSVAHSARMSASMPSSAARRFERNVVCTSSISDWSTSSCSRLSLRRRRRARAAGDLAHEARDGAVHHRHLAVQLRQRRVLLVDLRPRRREILHARRDLRLPLLQPAGCSWWWCLCASVPSLLSSSDYPRSY